MSVTVGYIEYIDSKNIINKIERTISSFARKNNFKETRFVYEVSFQDFYYTHWHEKIIFKVFSELQARDNLIINDFSSLSYSFFDSFYIASQIIDKGINFFSCHENFKLDNLSLNKMITENLKY